MDRGLEIILNGDGLDNPLILAIATALMEELGGGIVIGGMDGILCVFHIGTFDTEALDEHGRGFDMVRRRRRRRNTKSETHKF